MEASREKELAPGEWEKDYFRFWRPFDKCAGRPKCNVYHKCKVFARKASLCLVRSAFASSLTAFPDEISWHATRRTCPKMKDPGR